MSDASIKFIERLASIKCIAYDFDGVMTDNRCLVDENGKEAVFINRSDGYAIARFKELGIEQVIISTEKNPVVAARARKLGIEVYHGLDEKTETIKDYCLNNNLELEDVLYLGNDLNDLGVFSIVGLTGAPNDAEEEIIAVANWVSKRKGGYGVIRELYSLYLMAIRKE
jgi:YrbI family 3-deoxy-D-manno-octulosonate 8-phosphate phosphatase